MQDIIIEMKAGLYIVSTPIGNFEDITLRAIKTLQSSSIILCEDTRVSSKLMIKYSIMNARFKVYNDYSTPKDRQLIADLIDKGEVISLISDAGTPLISDPGYKLVKLLKEKNYHVDIVPGVCSVISALTLSTMAANRFIFCGFAPKTTNLQEQFFQELINIDATLIYFESPNRLDKSLTSALKVLGNRQASVVREITKIYQETKVDSLENLSKYYTENTIKGEIVVLISGKLISNLDSINNDIKEAIKTHLINGVSAKYTTTLVYNQFKNHINKSEIYKHVNNIKLTIK